MIHKCERCAYSTTAKSSLLNHLMKKNPCQPILCDIDRNELIEKLNNKNSLECTKCGNTFKNASAKCRHMKICNSSKKELDELKDTITTLTKRLEIAENKLVIPSSSSSSTTNNNIQNNIQNNCNNTYNITVNNFCNESIEHLPQRLILSCLVDMDMPRLLEQIHFDPEHPENHTVKMKNVNQKLLQYFEDGRWKVEHSDKVLDDLINSSGYKVLKAFYDNNPEMVNQEAEDYVGDSSDKLLKDIDKWFDKLEREDEKTFKELKNRIFLVVRNGSAMICQRRG